MAHWCPLCDEICYCNGDIGDIPIDDPAFSGYCVHDCEADDEDEDEDDDCDGFDDEDDEDEDDEDDEDEKY